MQYLILVIALAVALGLSIAFVPLRENSSSGPDLMPEQLERVVPQALEDGALPQEMAEMPGGDNAGRAKSGYFRWRGEDGSWHYGDHPPPGVDDYERVEVDPVTTKSADQVRGGAESSGEESP